MLRYNDIIRDETLVSLTRCILRKIIPINSVTCVNILMKEITYLLVK